MGRRETTTAVTMTVLAMILVLGGALGWRWLTADLPAADSAADPGPAADCTPAQVDAGERLHARQVRVSVYNAGTTAGLADTTMTALESRGFVRGDVGNAPEGVEVRRAQVLTGREGDPRARLVARHLGRRVPVRVTEEDLGPGVDVIVGDEFSGLARARPWIRVRQDQEVCVPAR